MEPIVINNQQILPGKKAKIEIPIAHLPSGTEIDLIVHVMRSRKPGPTLLVIGGVHGDEINGVEIVRRAIREKVFNGLTAGSVIAVPLLNVYGFINFSREFPSGKDVNRSFPGSKTGSLASRVAHTLTEKILPHCDYALDFHTGGSSIYNYPQSRVFRKDPESLRLAEMFSMPYMIKTDLIAKSLRKTGHNMDIPMVVFEGGESLRIDEFSIVEGIRGIRRVLNGLGMKEDGLKKNKAVVIDKSRWVRASRSGIFNCIKRSGDYIVKGDVLGIITDPYNSFQRKVIAKEPGFIYGHNNNPVVSQGDALYHIGKVEN